MVPSDIVMQGHETADELAVQVATLHQARNSSKPEAISKRTPRKRINKGEEKNGMQHKRTNYQKSHT